MFNILAPSSSPPPPLPHSLQAIVDIAFRYNPHLTIPVSGCCMSDSYSLYLQILFNFTHPAFPLSSSYLVSFILTVNICFVVFLYSLLQYVCATLI